MYQSISFVFQYATPHIDVYLAKSNLQMALVISDALKLIARRDAISAGADLIAKPERRLRLPRALTHRKLNHGLSKHANATAASSAQPALVETTKG
jgi:hypothetical protein